MKTFLPLLFAVFFLCLPSGCALVTARPKPPAGASQAGEVKVEQKGDAAVPAKAWSVTNAATVPLPAGSEVTFNEKLGTLSVKLSGETILTTTMRTDHAEGPQAFTPPAPPTPSDEANGRAVLLMRLGVVAGIAAGLFGLVRGWDFVMYGGGAVAGACLFGLFVERHPVLFIVAGAGVAAAVVGPWIYHTKLKRVTGPPSPLPSA